MEISNLPLRFRPLPAPLPDLDHLDDLPAGAYQRVVADAPNAYPGRRCLRDACPGDELLLMSYDPFLGDSPYRQAGPIFVHVHACAPDPLDLVRAPEQLLRRQLSVRGFDAAHRQIRTAVIDGADVEAASRRMLSDPSVTYLHVHNAGPGCFAVRVEHAGDAEESPK
jgi:hypothetical protein